jgi:hypothetical protein
MGAAFVTVLLVALFFRFFRLGTHPLGLFFDPAINGLDAIRLMQRGGPVLFFPTNGGRESLFMVLLIPFVQLLGPTPLALRTLTAAISLLNVALLVGFAAHLPANLYRLPTLGPPPATTKTCFTLLSGLILATMYWHIAVSRLGQRPILVPMLAVPVYWLFLIGWSDGRARWFVFSGLLLGLAVGYTYSAARLLPIILTLALLPELFTPRRRSAITGLLITAAAALLVYLPMGGYMLTHPAQFSARAGSVMVWNFLPTPTAIAAELGHNALRVAGFFCCAGSPNPIFGLPGYPGLSMILAPFLLIGLALSLWQWRSLPHRLLALWWLIGVAPSIIAIEAPHPLRMITAIPPTAILTALGLLAAVTWFANQLATRMSPARVRLAFFALPILLVLLPVPGLYRAYFIDWTARQDARGVYDYGAIAIRKAVLEAAAARPERPIYLPFSRFNDSTLLFYLSEAFPRQADVTASPAESALVISPEKYAGDTVWVRLFDHHATVLPPLTPAGRQLIQTALAGSAAIDLPLPYGNGESAARIAPLSTDPARYVQSLDNLISAEFGPLKLIGATYPAEIPAESPLAVTLFWEAQTATPDELEILVRLVTDSQQAVANGDARPTDWVYPTSFWRPGLDQIAAQHQLEFDPEQLPPGRYWLAVSVFDPALDQRLPLTAPPAASPDTVFIGPLKVARPAPATPPDLIVQSADFDGIIGLEGFKIEPEKAAPGDSLTLQLLWQAQAIPPLDYTVFVHLLAESGRLITGSDSPPLEGRYPTAIWTKNERILDSHRLPLPPDLPPGQYRLAVGLYHQPTGQRLPLLPKNAAADPADELILSRPLVIP